MGPKEARLRDTLSTANKAAVSNAQQEWDQGASLLRDVARALLGAAGPIQTQFGKQTGKAANEAFVTMADKVGRRAQEMTDASKALLDALTAIEHSENVRTSLDRDPLGSPPQAPVSTPGSSHQDDVDQQRAFHSAQATYAARLDKREADAEAASKNMDDTYVQSTTTMKRIHGEPDSQPPAPGSSTSGSGAGGTGGGGGGGLPKGATPYSPGSAQPTTTSGGHTTAGGHTTGGVTYDPHHPAGNNPSNLPTGTSQGGTPATPISGYPGGSGTSAPGTSVPTGSTGGISGSTAGGIAGAVGGGALGGMTGIGGAIRGPMAVPTGSAAGGSASSSGRIGSSSRTTGAVRGALGRSSGLAEEGVAGGRGTGSASGARSTGGGTRGASGKAGSRGRAGGRGSGVGSQSGKNKKDPKKKSPDFFEEEQDWVDDEGAAPGVID